MIRISVRRFGVMIFLIVMCVISVFPFVWMIFAATNKSIDIIRGNILPGTFLAENIKTLFITRPVLKVFGNSLRNSLAGTSLSLLICSMAGYGFTIYRDKAKDRLMAILLLSMMVPFASVMIHLFRMFSQARLLNTTAGFILPSLSTAFLIFFFRQSTVSFPMEIVQSARMDGMGEFSIYLRLYIPVMAPTFSAAAIVSFMNNWNNYLWPLIILQRQDSQTMPLLLAGLIAGYTTDYGILMLAVLICTLPTLILFISQQRRFVEAVLGHYR